MSSCTASSQYSSAYACTAAYDGNLATDWATLSEGVGSWIELDFHMSYAVSRMVYSNRGAAVERNKNVLLAFSDGLTESVRLTNDDDLSTFDFDAHVTTFVRITVDTVYTTVL